MVASNKLINRDPEILSGTPVFMGTRVPVQNLLDYMEMGHPLDDFLDDFPAVTREQAVEVIGVLKKLLEAQESKSI
ncbi:MAG TPA: DUF433 domain-containing protein [Chloroflexia bacterium]|jgi:uncharacterized protein (DUF433 family)